MAGHLIRRLHQRSTQVFQSEMQKAGFDLTPVQFAALEVLRTNPGIDQASLSAMIAYDRATIGGVIDRLEHKGLVERAVSESDRRARILNLTESGRRVVESALPVVRMLQTEILSNLDDAERKQFLAFARQALSQELE
ncbi:MarR family transcriptional regulator [Stappia sp. GBMRC 2046]|uniref:MarR family transcriptional regulator n=2 Tax=Stappia sediminis TaxID=2692190 RepID=A0A7X3LSR3_9HYPH|nr:MarR family transcriptional regulator [Stappia sediminis]